MLRLIEELLTCRRNCPIIGNPWQIPFRAAGQAAPLTTAATLDKTYIYPAPAGIFV